MGSIPGQGTKIPYAAWHGQKKKKKKTQKQKTVRVRLHFHVVFFCPFLPLNHVHVMILPHHISILVKMGRELRMEDGPENGLREALYQRLVCALPLDLSSPLFTHQSVVTFYDPGEHPARQFPGEFISDLNCGQGRGFMRGLQTLIPLWLRQ